MRIVFISRTDPHNKNSRSGVPYSIYKQLAKQNEVIWIKPEITGVSNLIKLFFIKLFLFIFRKLGYNFIHIPSIVRMECQATQRKLDNLQYDCIFGMGSKEVAYLHSEKPIFCRADAIAHSFVNYYAFNVPKFAIKWAHSVEERALHNITRFFIPSQWVLDEIHKYHINEPDEKFVLVETGANLETEYIKYKEHIYGIDQKLNMFMCGYDVMRKGLDIAVDACKILNDTYNIKAYITVIGGRPSDEILKTGFVFYKGLKNKNNSKEFDEFYTEFANADLFIFPTKAECHGIVNCEASAYGLPIFSNNTGGVGTYCIDKYNGRCLPVESTGKEYAIAIYNAIKSGDIYMYSKNSRKLFEEKFNWDSWGGKVMPIIKNIVYTK